MSFSSEIKDELCRILPDNKEILLSELIAIIHFAGKIKISENNEYRLLISTDSSAIARKCFTLFKKTFNITTDINIIRSSILGKSHKYKIIIKKDEDVKRILRTVNLIDSYDNLVDDFILKLKDDNCKRAYLRGAFLIAGSITNPERAYHLEIVSQSKDIAISLQELILSLSIEVKYIIRKKLHIIYLKDSENISTMIGLIGASVSLLNFENIRVLKDMRNTINRKVNCETANINKTVNAALKQVSDIQFLSEAYGLENLSKSLYEIAIKRIEKPEASLKELGESLDPPVGKSGVNHRLRKLGELAERLRNER